MSTTKEVRYKLVGDATGLKKSAAESAAAFEKAFAAQQKAQMSMSSAHDAALRMDAAMARSAQQRAAAIVKAAGDQQRAAQQAVVAQQRAAMQMSAMHEQALRMNAAMETSSQKVGKLAGAVSSTATTMARAGGAMGLPVQALKTLDDVSDVAALGFDNLSKSTAGFNAASIGVVGAGLAIGATIGNLLMKIPAFKEAVDDAAKSVDRLFSGASHSDIEAKVAAANHAILQKKMFAHSDALLRSQTAGMSSEDAKKFLGLEQKLGMREQIVADIEKEEAATKKATEAWKRHNEEMKRARDAYLPPQEAADKLVEAMEGVNLQQDLSGQGAQKLAEDIRRLQEQGAKLPPTFLAFAESLEASNRQAQLMGPTLAQLEGREGTGGVAQLPRLMQAGGTFATDLFNATPASKTIFIDAGAKAGDAVGEGMGAGIKKSLGAALKGMPQVILGAIQGGGNVSQAVGTHLGSSIGDTIGQSLGKKIGGVLGGAVGSVVPVVGTLLGGVIGSKLGGLFGKLFGGGGPSEAEKKKALDETLAKLDDLQKKIDAFRMDKLKEGLTGVNAVLAHLGKVEDLSQDRLNNVGLMGSAIFAEMRRQGASFAEAFEAAMPALSQAAQVAAEHGLQLEGTFGALAEFAARVGENEGLVNAVEGLGQISEALRTNGMLNQDSANSIMAELAAQQEEMAAAGFSTEQQANLAAEALFNLKKASDDGKISLDAQTQAMVDMAEASGAFEGLEDPMQQLVELQKMQLEVMAAQAKMFGATLPAEIQKYIDKLHQVPAIPGVPGGGGGGTVTHGPDLHGGSSSGIEFGGEGAAGGGEFNGPSSGYSGPTMHGREFIVPGQADYLRALGQEIAAAGGMGGGTFHITVKLEERVVDEFIIEGMRGDRNGLASETARHLPVP